eukprot:TRINITY_DN751_c4_g1_i1.p1 TRINITY_DN751_c4_g1~~TRINITY_DN751_c4_g1_i1.p1  ORF type:complete len:787 (+),score=192.99 TRINITY_DN751_c4_g1_i1:182-2542(+)
MSHGSLQETIQKCRLKLVVLPMYSKSECCYFKSGVCNSGYYCKYVHSNSLPNCHLVDQGFKCPMGHYKKEESIKYSRYSKTADDFDDEDEMFWWQHEAEMSTWEDFEPVATYEIEKAWREDKWSIRIDHPPYSLGYVITLRGGMKSMRNEHNGRSVFVRRLPPNIDSASKSRPPKPPPTHPDYALYMKAREEVDSSESQPEQPLHKDTDKVAVVDKAKSAMYKIRCDRLQLILAETYIKRMEGRDISTAVDMSETCYQWARTVIQTLDESDATLQNDKPFHNILNLIFTRNLELKNHDFTKSLYDFTMKYKIYDISIKLDEILFEGKFPTMFRKENEDLDQDDGDDDDNNNGTSSFDIKIFATKIYEVLKNILKEPPPPTTTTTTSSDREKQVSPDTNTIQESESSKSSLPNTSAKGTTTLPETKNTKPLTPTNYSVENPNPSLAKPQFMWNSAKNRVEIVTDSVSFYNESNSSSSTNTTTTTTNNQSSTSSSPKKSLKSSNPQIPTKEVIQKICQLGFSYDDVTLAFIFCANNTHSSIKYLYAQSGRKVPDYEKQLDDEYEDVVSGSAYTTDNPEYEEIKILRSILIGELDQPLVGLPKFLNDPAKRSIDIPNNKNNNHNSQSMSAPTLPVLEETDPIPTASMKTTTTNDSNGNITVQTSLNKLQERGGKLFKAFVAFSKKNTVNHSDDNNTSSSPPPPPSSSQSQSAPTESMLSKEYYDGEGKKQGDVEIIYDNDEDDNTNEDDWEIIDSKYVNNTNISSKNLLSNIITKSTPKVKIYQPYEDL